MKELPPPPEPTSLNDLPPYQEAEILQSVKLEDIHDESVVKKIAGNNLPRLLASNIGVDVDYQALLTDRQLNIKGGWKSVYSKLSVGNSTEYEIKAIKGTTDSTEVRLEFGLNFGIESDVVSIGTSLSKAVGRTITLEEGTEITSSDTIDLKEQTRFIVWQAYQIYEIVNNLRLMWSIDTSFPVPGFPGVRILFKRSQIGDTKAPLPAIQLVQTLNVFSVTTYPRI